MSAPGTETATTNSPANPTPPHFRKVFLARQARAPDQVSNAATVINIIKQTTFAMLPPQRLQASAQRSGRRVFRVDGHPFDENELGVAVALGRAGVLEAFARDSVEYVPDAVAGWHAENLVVRALLGRARLDSGQRLCRCSGDRQQRAQSNSAEKLATSSHIPCPSKPDQSRLPGCHTRSSHASARTLCVFSSSPGSGVWLVCSRHTAPFTVATPIVCWPSKPVSTAGPNIPSRRTGPNCRSNERSPKFVKRISFAKASAANLATVATSVPLPITRRNAESCAAMLSLV